MWVETDSVFIKSISTFYIVKKYVFYGISFDLLLHCISFLEKIAYCGNYKLLFDLLLLMFRHLQALFLHEGKKVKSRNEYKNKKTR